MLVLQIDYQNTNSPASVGLDSSDKRALAVFFRSLRLEYKGGEVAVDFSASGNLRQSALFGFSHSEDEGAWSAGMRSALAFNITPLCSGKIRLTLEAHCFESAFPECEIKLATSSGHQAQAVVAKQKRLEIALKRPLFLKKTRIVTGDMHSLDRRRNVSMRGDKPIVSIILLNCNKPLLTRAAVVAAASSKLGVSFEILCVDNGSTAENLKHLRESEVEMRFLELPENKGFGEANNLAATEARGEFLLFLNNDVFLQSGWVDEMLKCFEIQPDCGAVGPVLRWPDGTLQEAGCGLQPDGYPIRHGRGDANFSVNALKRYQSVDYVSGACLMMRRTDFLEIGGFDPIYSPAYYEDTDLCMRLREKGKTVYLASRAECYHIENATSHGAASTEWATRQSEKNRLIFIKRWDKILK